MYVICMCAPPSGALVVCFVSRSMYIYACIEGQKVRDTERCIHICLYIYMYVYAPTSDALEPCLVCRCMYVCMYVYVRGERERKRDVCTYAYVVLMERCMYICICCTDGLPLLRAVV